MVTKGSYKLHTLYVVIDQTLQVYPRIILVSFASYLFFSCYGGLAEVTIFPNVDFAHLESRGQLVFHFLLIIFVTIHGI